MQWFKSHTSLRHKPEYRRMSPLARSAFDNAMRTAADLEHGDSLSTDDGFPLTEDELSYNLIVPQKNLKAVLDELFAAHFFTKDEHGVIHIAKFKEKTEASTERVRKHREKKHLETLHETVSVTVSETVSETNPGNVPCNGVTKRTEIEEEIEEEIEIEEPKGSGDSAPRQPRLPVGQPSDIVAYRILDAAWPVVSRQHDIAMSRDTWRKRNKAAAVDLAELGKMPADVVEMLRLAYEHPEGKRFYGGIVMLAKLAEHWPKLVALDSEGEDQSETRRAIARGDFLPRV